MKMRNAELHLRGAAFSFGLQPFAARLPKLVLKLESLDCFHALVLLCVQERISEQALNRRVSDDTKLLRFTSLR